MAETIKEGDFVEINFTGRVKPEGFIFDTTSLDVAKENHLYNPKIPYGPITVCVGKNLVLGGLDKGLVGREIGKTEVIDIAPENAFGKKDAKKLKLVPTSTFKKNKVNPQPGLQVTIDNTMGVIKKVSGGRCIVDFNHMLAGKDLSYEVDIMNKVTDKVQQVGSLLTLKLNMKSENYSIEVNDDKAEIMLRGLPSLPDEMIKVISDFIKECTGLTDVAIKLEKK